MWFGRSKKMNKIMFGIVWLGIQLAEEKEKYRTEKKIKKKKL